jgi:hypothetical protein
MGREKPLMSRWRGLSNKWEEASGEWGIGKVNSEW